MNGFIDQKSYEHALRVAAGPYPSPALVPHPLMNLTEAAYAAQCLFLRGRHSAGNRAERLRAYFADCQDVLLECQR